MNPSPAATVKMEGMVEPKVRYLFTTLAGWARIGGNADGTGSAARFASPWGMAVDSAGHVYVVDSGNHTIRKITPGGEVTTFAGLAREPGSADGTGSAARFAYPKGVAMDSAGYLYVADSRNNTIRKITPDGEVTTLAGAAGTGGRTDGTGRAARFSFPHGVAVDSAGHVYVTDAGNHTIRKITPGGKVTTLAGAAGYRGSVDGTGSAARFDSPNGMAVDSLGSVYVANTQLHTIRKITPGGAVTTLAGLSGEPGSADGTGSMARLFFPEGVAVDEAGHVYVVDTGNHSIRKITPSGAVTTLVKWGGSPDAAQAGFPNGIAVDGTGNLYVSERMYHSILVGRPMTEVEPAPSLVARWDGGQIILSWPQTAVGYELESSGELGGGALWSPVTTGIGTEGASFTHSNAPAQGIRFFRLRKP